jgi:hypothetical protein
MQTPHLEAVENARMAIEDVITVRELGVRAVPYFAPTDIGTLPPFVQEEELRVEEENDYGNRVRAGIHMTLSAAVAALGVAEDLMKAFATIDPVDRKKELLRCSLNSHIVVDAASEASAVLSGQLAPKADAMVEIKRLKTVLAQRFGMGELQSYE